MPAGPAPPRAPSITSTRVGIRAPVGGRGRHPVGGEHGRAGWGVDLGVVVQLDDLAGLEPGGRHLGESHHEHGADGEVGCDHAAGTTVGGEGVGQGGAGRASSSPVVPITAWMPWAAHQAALAVAAGRRR